MRLLARTVLPLFSLASGTAPAQDSQTIRIIRAGSQPFRQGPPGNFTGSVRVAPLFQAQAPGRWSGSLVTFEPGARTAWHTPPLGQILIVTAGRGRVERWGDPVEEIREGDVVWMDVPLPVTFGGRALRALTVTDSEFTLLTKIPIVIYYGDNIPEEPSVNPGQEQWRIFFEMAKRWRDVVNRHGGDVTVVHLPETGIRGNTHFPMSDRNNLQIADLVSKFLSEKKLD
jgi:quercetin dioxygenase-like cupin family protein